MTVTEYVPRSDWTTADRGGEQLTDAKLEGLAIHYPGDGNVTYANLTKGQVGELIRAYWRHHVLTKKWSDIGYQAAIDQAGRVWDLRGIDRVPAAHASEDNRDANWEFGAVLFVVGNSEMPSARLIAAFNTWARDRWLKRWPKATKLTVHRRVPGAQTECPGSRITGLVDTGKLHMGGPSTRPPATSPTKPSVSLSKLIEAARTDPPRSSTKARYPTGTRRVEAALLAEGLLPRQYRDRLGHFGSKTVEAYAAWQRKCGYTGRDADGIPGKASLTKLGAKHGFTVRP